MVALGGGPFSLVDGELTQTVLAGIGIALDDNPGRGVGYTEVEDFAGRDEVVEGLHHFRDAGMHVPVVDVELGKEDEGQQCRPKIARGLEGRSKRYQVDIGGLELLQTGFDGDV